MKLPIVVFSLLSTIALGADRDALLEGCSSIPDAEKRAKCFEAVARMPALPSVEQTTPQDRAGAMAMKYEAVNRASTAIHAAVDAGASYREYGPYVQQFSIEVAVAKQKLGDKSEDTAIDLLERAIDAYRDAGTFWNASITFFANSNNRSAFSGLPIRASGTEWLANKYGMTVQSVDFFGLNRGVQTGDGISRILRHARDYVVDANKRLLVVPSNNIADDAPLAHALAIAVPPPSGNYWVGSDPDRIYYLPTCAEGERVSKLNRVLFPDERSAETSGFRRSKSPGC